MRSIDAENVRAAFGGSEKEIPIEFTDLKERAARAMEVASVREKSMAQLASARAALATPTPARSSETSFDPSRELTRQVSAPRVIPDCMPRRRAARNCWKKSARSTGLTRSTRTWRIR